MMIRYGFIVFIRFISRAKVGWLTALQGKVEFRFIQFLDKTQNAVFINCLYRIRLVLTQIHVPAPPWLDTRNGCARFNFGLARMQLHDSAAWSD